MKVKLLCDIIDKTTVTILYMTYLNNERKTMDHFNNYISNTVLGSGNNSILIFSKPITQTGMMFVKLRNHGKQNYRFMFSNTVDSTFDHGQNAYANLKGDIWNIDSLEVADGGKIGNITLNSEGTIAINGFDPDYCSTINRFIHVTFNGKYKCEVPAGEKIWTDEFELDIPENHYLAIKITFTGNNVPYTPDKIVPCFVSENGHWHTGRDFPQPVFIGIEENKAAPVKRIGFLGDSITQGLGTTVDAYEYWVADIAEALPCDKFSVWDLGLGFGRAEDAASCGVWLNRAKNNDIVFVCFGVNDILQYCDSDRICKALTTIIDFLNNASVKTGIFTVPPFDFSGNQASVFDTVNSYIRNDLSKRTDYFFDMASILCKPDDHTAAAYGGHPDKNGCRAVADNFLREIQL